MGNKPTTNPPQCSRDNAVPPSDIPRLVAGASLPRYAYVPGVSPRPAEAGHADPISPAKWQSCRPYLLGIDLFNHGYYWEAHESWEAVWLAAGRSGHTADFLKGLIKLAAAFVKARQGQPVGVARHARRASELFRTVAAEAGNPPVVMGLALEQLDQEAIRVANQPEHVVNTSDMPVVRLTTFVMITVDGPEP